MRQAVLRAAQDVEIREREPPTIEAGDVRIAVDLCGVCGSDIGSYLYGHYVDPGQVMGHEFTGRVVAIGSGVSHLGPGTRVVGRPLRSCGLCWYCRRGDINLCGHTGQRSVGYGADGAFADELTVDDEATHAQLVPIESITPAADAVWAEPLAVGLHALGRGEVGPGMEVSIVGAGPIGLATAAAAVASGALVTIIEPRPARLAAANRLGAARAVSPDRLPPNPVEVVLDTSGSAQAIADAASRLVAGGRLVLVGLGRAPVPDVPPCVLVRGSFAFSVREFARAAHLIDSGLVRLGAMISHSFGLDNTAEAIETAAKEVSALKVVVAPNANG